MREILFRGFHPDENGIMEITLNGEKIKGEWVEGDFSHPHNICNETLGYDEITKQDNVPIWNDFNVMPETVGQFTGLTDKNGKKIFEGDIVAADGYRDAVCFEDGYFHPMGSYVARSGFMYDNSDYEVVGNIFENPERLGGGNQ